jgi:hypothetical protein
MIVQQRPYEVTIVESAAYDNSHLQMVVHVDQEKWQSSFRSLDVTDPDATSRTVSSPKERYTARQENWYTDKTVASVIVALGTIYPAVCLATFKVLFSNKRGTESDVYQCRCTRVRSLRVYQEPICKLRLTFDVIRVATWCCRCVYSCRGPCITLRLGNGWLRCTAVILRGLSYCSLHSCQ